MAACSRPALRSKSGNSRTVGHYNGTTWTTTSLTGVLPSGAVSLTSVRASSANSVWVAGYELRRIRRARDGRGQRSGLDTP